MGMGISIGRFICLGLAAAFLFTGIASQAQVQHSYGATDLPNVWTATNDFALGLYTGPLTFAQITSTPFPQPGTTVLCSNCSLSSNPCTIGSSQVIAVYLNGAWVCNTGGGSSGGGTLTGLTVGSGLTGGGSSGSVNVSLLSTCSASQVLEWNGSAWACATAGTGDLKSIPPAGQNVVQPCAGSPCQSTAFTENNNIFIRQVTPSWNWLQTDIAGSIGNLTSAGAATLTLTPCPLGIDTASASHNYVYVVRIAGTGTPEQATVTGGTCTPGLASGTVTVTTLNAHAAGFTVGSASTGIQEAWNDAWVNDIPMNANSTAAPSVKLMAGTNYTVYSTVYMRGRGGQLDGAGAFIVCSTRDKCFEDGVLSTVGYHKLYTVTAGSTLNIDGVQVASASAVSGTITITTVSNHPFSMTANNGGPDWVVCEIHSQTSDSRFMAQIASVPSSTSFTVAFGSSTYSAGANTFGFCGLENTFFENNSDHVAVQDFQLTQLFPSTAPGAFSYGIINGNDQQFIISRAANRGTSVIKNSANWPMGAFFYQRTDQGNAGIMYVHDTELTNVNCADGGGNGFVITESVCQGFPVYGSRYFGGLQPSTHANEYEESTSATVDPLYGYAASMGMLLAGGQGHKIVGTFPVSGLAPQFPTAGGNGPASIQYFVLPHSSTMGVGPMWYIGKGIPLNGSVSVPLQWPSIELQDGAGHNSLGTLTWDILATTGVVTPPVGTGNFAVATGISGSCGTNGMCSFTDTQAARSSYTVPATQGFLPVFWFWPANVVLNNTNLLWDEGPSNPGAVATQGIQSVAITSPACQPLNPNEQRTPILIGCPTVNNVNEATVMQTLPGGAANTKGRINLGSGTSVPTDILTLYDSNFPKTASTAGERPSADVNDIAISIDQSGGLAQRSASSISNYVGFLADNASYQERLTSSLKIINVPVSLTTLSVCRQVGIALTSFDLTNTAEYHSSLCPGETVKQLLANCPATGTCTVVVDEGTNVNFGAAGTGGGSGDYPVLIGAGYQSTGGAGVQWTNVTLDIRGVATCTQTGLTLPTTVDCAHVGNYGKIQGPNDGNNNAGGGQITTAANATYRYLVSNAGVCASPCTPGPTGAPGWMNYIQGRFLYSGVALGAAGTAQLQALLNVTACEGRCDLEHFEMLGLANTTNILIQDGPNSGDTNNMLLSDVSSYCGNVAGCVPLSIVSGGGGNGINIKLQQVTLGDTALGSGCNSGNGCLLNIDGTTGGTTNSHYIADINYDGLYFEINGTYPTWAATTPFGSPPGQGKCIKPTVNNSANDYFCATSAGTTSSTQPNWGSACATTCADGSVIWTNQGTNSPSHVMELNNVRDFKGDQFNINSGVAGNCVTLNHSVNGLLGVIRIVGYVANGHCTQNIIQNLVTGSVLSGATPTDVDWEYPGDVGGKILDGSMTATTLNVTNLNVSGTCTGCGGGASTLPPGWLAYYGSGSDGASTIATNTNLSGIKYYTTFAVTSGAVVTSNNANTPLIIRATTSISICGTCSIVASGLNTTTGDSGGSGGGGGGGAAAGAAGNAIKGISAGSYQSILNGGAAGAASGGTGGNGNATSGTLIRSFVDTGMGEPEINIIGGAGGGTGGSTGGAGGPGGGCIILIAPVITLSSGAQLTSTGSAGTAGGASTGGGGGGGGGCIIVRSPGLVDSGAVFNVTGGAGGAAGTGTSGAGGNGGNGWTTELSL
jgi:hypothetical protein